MVALDRAKLLLADVADADAEPAILLRHLHRDREGGVGVFADIVKKIVEHALEILHVQPDAAGLLRPRGLYREAMLLEQDHWFAQQLLGQNDPVVFLKVELQLPPAEHQRVAEQLVGQRFELLGLGIACVKILLKLLLRPVLAVLRQIEIAQQRRQRIADVVGHGGDQLAVFLQRVLLLQRLADERTAHHIHVPRQPPHFVVAAGLHLHAQISAPDLLNLARDGDDAAGDAAVVPEHDEREQRAAQRDADDLHGIVELGLGEIVDDRLKNAVAEADGIQLERDLLIQLRAAKAELIVHAPPARLHRQMAVFIEQNVDILLLDRPYGQLVRIPRGKIIVFNECL